jgi:hypothetical protein
MLILMSTSRIQKNKNNNRLERNESKIEGFFPREHAILAEYFDLQEKQPQQARAFDPHEITSEENIYDEAVEGIACRKSYGSRDYNAIDNAVARIALAPVRGNLPTWGCLGKDGAFHSRQLENESLLPVRGYRSDPVHVLSINWASSGPGYSWPLKYYISWIPYYERYVVTVSYDSPEVEGYLDLAIGYLAEGASVEKELKSVIVRHWDRDSMYLQGWEGVIDPGIVKDPWTWREEVSWGYNDDGEEIAFLEEEDDEE